MKQNLGIMKPHYSKQILADHWPYAILRFHCIIFILMSVEMRKVITLTTVSALLHLFIKLDLRVMANSFLSFFQIVICFIILLMFLQLGACVPSQMFVLSWEHNSRLENEHLAMPWGFVWPRLGGGGGVEIPCPL